MNTEIVNSRFWSVFTFSNTPCKVRFTSTTGKAVVHAGHFAKFHAHVRKIGEFYYNFWVDSANPRGVLRRCTMEAYRAGHQGGAGTAWETVLDVDKLNAEEGENCK